MNNSIGSSGSSNNSSYPSMMPGEHDSALSGGSFRIFDSSYNSYSPHPPPYSDYATASKLEAFDYNYWPSTATTTHNILALPTTANTTGTVLDQIRTPPPSLSSSSGQPIETLLPVSSVHLAQINATTTISATHHHHHIYQHVYPAPSNDPSTWLGSGEYQPLHTAANPANFRHYPTSCSLYPSNNFYDPSQTSQWTTAPHSSHLPIKFEPPYSPPYMESIHHLDQPSSEDALQHHEHISKDEPADSSGISSLNKSRQQQQQQQQFDWLKQPPPSASSSSGIPPKNPVNGKTRTRDKYRIVYTDHQRYELENEFVVSKYITIPRKAALSMNLSLSERQIKIWFQNRRAKERKLNKKRQELCHHQLNNSNDADSPSDGGPESPNYYQNYA